MTKIEDIPGKHCILKKNGCWQRKGLFTCMDGLLKQRIYLTNQENKVDYLIKFSILLNNNGKKNPANVPNQRTHKLYIMYVHAIFSC